MQKPKTDEIELSVFGPGYGECIVLHIGYGEWIIVDSCIDPKTKKVSAIDYFNKIGVDLDSVKMIVITHWHDDHICGLFELYEKCTSSELVMPAAFCQDDFLDLASLFHNKDDLGVSEFSKTWVHLLNNKIYPKMAIGSRTLYDRNIKNQNIQCKIESLSPSDAAMVLANNGISKLIPSKPKNHEIPKLRRRLKALDPNYSAVVLLITINNIKILLGSDLEVGKNKDLGWLAILNSDINCKAQIFKIPHHGSSNGDDPLIWQKLLKEKPITITTPFVNGDVALPKKDDIERIQSNSGEAYLTALPRTKNSKTEHFIDKMMKADVKSRKLLNPFYGHVRLRANANDQDWEAALSENAVKIK